jgi:hypothetical protein
MVMLTVSDWWMALGRSVQLCWIIAVVFTVLMLIQRMLSLTSESYPNVKTPGFVSLPNIIAFLAFLGWTGIIMLSIGIPIWLAIPIGLTLGSIATMLLIYTIKWFSGLEKGQPPLAEHMVFQAGVVYQTIPGRRSGSGKIMIKTRQGLSDWNAETDGPAILPGTEVYVTDALSSHTLLVSDAMMA